MSSYTRCPNCKVLQPPGSKGRCAPCRGEARRGEDARRGGTTARGYGWHRHQKPREQAIADAIGKPCPRCGLPMLEGQALDFGHTVPLSVDPNSKADRVEHAWCNRSAKDRPDAPRGGTPPRGGQT